MDFLKYNAYELIVTSGKRGESEAISLDDYFSSYEAHHVSTRTLFPSISDQKCHLKPVRALIHFTS